MAGLPSAEFWRGRRVLLTGHTGFKGAWAALWLGEMGANVTGLSLAPDASPNLFELANAGASGKSCIADLRDAAAVHKILIEADPEIIIHMAAQALVRRSYREPVETFAANVHGTVHLLEAARGLKSLRACLIVTSDKVYENDGSARPFNEDSRLGGHDPYSASKAAVEIVVASYRRSFFSEGAVRVATARGGNVIGGGDFSEDRIVPDILRAHAAGVALSLRYPDATRPWQHVLDCLCGYFVYAEHLARAAAVPTALNFGPREGQSRPVRELVEAMQLALGEQRGWVQELGVLQKEMPALALSCAKAEKVLGWRSLLDAGQTIDWTAAWFRSHAAGADARAISLAQIARYMAHTNGP